MIKVNRNVKEEIIFESENFFTTVNIVNSKIHKIQFYKNNGGNLGFPVSSVRSPSELMELNSLLDKVEETILHGGE